MLTKSLYTIGLLVLANVFMTIAWYGHLKFPFMKGSGGNAAPLILVILISWGFAFFEYCLMIPANRIGFIDNGGNFTLFQLKIIQEVITLSVFIIFAVLLFRTETFRLNHLWSFLCLIGAVYFAFRK